jgi:hypothetical protein
VEAGQPGVSTTKSGVCEDSSPARAVDVEHPAFYTLSAAARMVSPRGVRAKALGALGRTEEEVADFRAFFWIIIILQAGCRQNKQV